jgi:hypothetical protein
MRTKTWKLIPTIKRLHYIDIKFPILRSKVFIPSIKRFRFYMENILLQKRTCIVTTQNHLEILSILRFIVITPINDVANT